MADTLYLKQMECGPMQNYVYLIGDPATRQAAVVDPAWDVERVVQTAQQDGYTITKVLITHTHQDHTGGEFFGHYIPGVVELLELVRQVLLRTERVPDHREPAEILEEDLQK